MDPDNPDSVIESIPSRVREDNPEKCRSSVPIELRLGKYSAEQLMRLQDAIADNTGAENFALDLAEFVEAEGTNLDPLLAVLDSRENVKSIVVRGGSHEMTHRCLRSAAKSTCLHKIVLFNAIIAPGALTSFLNSSASIQDVVIDRCVFEAGTHPTTAAADLADAFGSCASLKYAVFNKVNMTYLKPIVERLRNHMTLESLQIWGTRREGDDRNLVQLVASVVEHAMATTVTLVLANFDFEGQELFPVAQAAIGFSNVRLHFDKCSFDSESTRLFESMVAPASKLTYLGINCGCTFASEIACTLGALLHPTSSLEKVVVCGLGDAAVPILTTIMGALEINSQIEYLFLGSIRDPDAFQALLSGIPKMSSLRRLVCHEFDFPTFSMDSLIQALKRNSSLELFTYNELANVYSEDDKAKLAMYAARNKSLAALVKNPGSIPMSVWPLIIERVQDCEYGTSLIFQALQSLGPEAVGVGQRRKMRSRIKALRRTITSKWRDIDCTRAKAPQPEEGAPCSRRKASSRRGKARTA